MLRVSLIMTCYNSIENYRASMENALLQDYPDIEFVVVDGGSTDGTVELIREYDERLRNDASLRSRRMTYVSERDCGIYDGMNKGIRMATGDVIAVFNDLFTRTDAISLLMAALEERDADGVHADLIYVDHGICKRWWRMGDGGMHVQSGTAQEHDQQPRSATGNMFRVTYPQIHTGWMPAHPTLYLRRAVYEQFGEYSLALSVSADYDYMLRILTGRDAIRLVYVPQTLISMFYGGASNGGFKGYAENIRQAYMALLHNHVTFPLTAIVCRTFRTIMQYRSAGEYRPID